jgi:hypothetical protein
LTRICNLEPDFSDQLTEPTGSNKVTPKDHYNQYLSPLVVYMFAFVMETHDICFVVLQRAAQ